MSDSPFYICVNSKQKENKKTWNIQIQIGLGG